MYVMYVCMYVYKYACMYLYVCMYVYKYACMYLYVCIYIYMCVCLCVYRIFAYWNQSHVLARMTPMTSMTSNGIHPPIHPCNTHVLKVCFAPCRWYGWNGLAGTSRRCKLHCLCFFTCPCLWFAAKCCGWIFIRGEKAAFAGCLPHYSECLPYSWGAIFLTIAAGSWAPTVQHTRLALWSHWQLSMS